MCHRPFNWRKKWESCWDEVTTCSKSCNRQRRADQQQMNRRLATALSSIPNDNLEDEVTDFDTKLDGNDVLVSEIQSAVDQHMIDDASVGSSSSVECASTLSILNKDDTKDEDVEILDPRAARKAAKKLAKLERRAKREGRAGCGQKSCDVCQKPVNLLIRCTIDASGEWKMVCGKCWHFVSGGVVDGDANHPHYRYGGLWKNRSRSA
jgi:hypothetical protein